MSTTILLVVANKREHFQNFSPKVAADPSIHGAPRQTKHILKHDWSIRTLIRTKPDEARRIAANIAKLPELLRQP